MYNNGCTNYRTSQFGGSYGSSVGVVTTLRGSMLAGTKGFFLSSVTSKWLWADTTFKSTGEGAKITTFSPCRAEKVWVELYLLHPDTLTTALHFPLYNAFYRTVRCTTFRCCCQLTWSHYQRDTPTWLFNFKTSDHKLTVRHGQA
jgi:hypothetical protein